MAETKTKQESETKKTFEKVELVATTNIAIQDNRSEKVLSVEDALVQVLNDLDDLKRGLL